MTLTYLVWEVLLYVICITFTNEKPVYTFSKVSAMSQFEAFVQDVFEPKFWGYIKIQNHQELPSGYGFAYRCVDRDGFILYPIPIHLFIRMFRWFWGIVLYAGFPNVWERMIQKSREDGFNEGLERRNIILNDQIKKTMATLEKSIEISYKLSKLVK